jgi:hypothetical protein
MFLGTIRPRPCGNTTALGDQSCPWLHPMGRPSSRHHRDLVLEAIDMVIISETALHYLEARATLSKEAITCAFAFGVFIGTAITAAIAVTVL